ncbi:YfgM family protein [Ramlibacter tataouinensis]|uniref:Ancillary SecYEG translocon subunit n=1 Tax=Ramlibacter tataouinensis (strain ATCC BAA-407 / DSM 14655 / LMG 21543 / TTB310) TaxID=365046 RepID=F5XX43_RAMTT|nr:tetratricopeptide repeat protein [Ramlibacter tataouinensis]AEG92987.1 conserved hypothetical protein [Ramlibacter tataouinensis TTB310]
MAKHLDLEEQEQLDQLKHFWNAYGNLITWLLIAVFGSIAAWNGWQYWQRQQGLRASALYEEVERAAQAGDLARLQRGFDDVKDKFGGTLYAAQAGLLAAETFFDKGNADASKAALGWVAAESGNAGYQAVARLRLAGLLTEAKAYDQALQQLAGEFPNEFAPLAADRRGDIYNLQGKKAEARAEYARAYQGLEGRAEYRRLVEVKLASLGGDPKAAEAPAAAASGTAKP